MYIFSHILFNIIFVEHHIEVAVCLENISWLVNCCL